MKRPDIFGIWLTQKCPLRCTFCPNSDEYFKTGAVMSLDVFKSKVQQIIQSKIEYIDLTPIIGEVLGMKDLNIYLDYLDSCESIKRYTFITSLICSKRQIDMIINRPKLKLEISLYGTNKDMFLERTRRDSFVVFFNNFKRLVSKHTNTKDIIIINRTTDPTLSQDIKPGLNILLRSCTIDNSNIKDRDNYIEERNDEPELCYYMQEPLLTEEGICFCCMDWHKKYLSKKSIDEFYSKDMVKFKKNVKSTSSVCNTKCGWYKPPIERSLDILK